MLFCLPYILGQFLESCDLAQSRYSLRARFQAHVVHIYNNMRAADHVLISCRFAYSSYLIHAVALCGACRTEVCCRWSSGEGDAVMELTAMHIVILTYNNVVAFSNSCLYCSYLSDNYLSWGAANSRGARFCTWPVFIDGGNPERRGGRYHYRWQSISCLHPRIRDISQKLILQR